MRLVDDERARPQAAERLAVRGDDLVVEDRDVGASARPRPGPRRARRCGAAASARASRCQLSFSDAGQTTIAGKAPSASSVASAWTVLPRPCSSARKRGARPARSARRPLERRELAAEHRGDLVDRLGARSRASARIAAIAAACSSRSASSASAPAPSTSTPKRRQERVERLDDPRIDRQRAAARVGAGQLAERRARVAVPQHVEPQALAVERAGRRQPRRRRLDAATAAPRRSAARRRRSAALLLVERLGAGPRRAAPAARRRRA